ncbi:MAG: ATP-binding protein [Oscillospiraceae bacterium]|jgi:AAA+ ATPase superfamily predicted ATPase|nr:ATP-binding protein [Oscillospiraceae bacterium]
MFVGREAELSVLERLYGEVGFQMVILYGRRRIGKTVLISEFAKGKPALLFTAQEANDAMNLARFSKKIYQFFDIPDSAGAFGTWQDAFAFLGEKARERRFVFAFDEFPYAAAANRALKSVLQIAIDHVFKDTGLFLILCGSHMGFMETEVLGYKSPLFGRRTAQIKLEGFDYYDAGRMLGGFSYEDKLRLYACVGGTPHYLAQIRASESFETNIKRLYFDSAGYLYNEPVLLLHQELREPALYNAIVSAIAGGASKLNEIATKIGEETAKVNKYLQTLVQLKILCKEYPFGENPRNSRKGLYRVADNCYHFWYRFVFFARPEIESGQGDIVADAEVFGERLSTYIGKPPFEQICLQYVRRMNRAGRLPFTATAFGAWWGRDPQTRAQTDIDVVAATRTEGKILLGECKWRNSPVRAEEIETLMAKEHLLDAYTDRYSYVFSKVSFSREVRKREGSRLTLVTTDMLFA